MLAMITAFVSLFKQLASAVIAHPVRFIILALVIALGVTYCQTQRLETKVTAAQTEAKTATQVAEKAQATTAFVTTDQLIKEQVNLDIAQGAQANLKTFDQIDAELQQKLQDINRARLADEQDQQLKQQAAKQSVKASKATTPKLTAAKTNTQQKTAATPPPAGQVPAVDTPAPDYHTQVATVVIDSLWDSYNAAAKVSTR